MTPLRFHGPVLPDGEPRDVYVVDGRVTRERPAGAESAGRGWILPGLVDAHNHLGLEDDGAVDDEETERQALLDRDAGALLLRDAGSPADTRWVHTRRREVLMLAYEAGVELYVGSDGGAEGHGHLAGEMVAMVDPGVGPRRPGLAGS